MRASPVACWGQELPVQQHAEQAPSWRTWGQHQAEQAEQAAGWTALPGGRISAEGLSEGSAAADSIHDIWKAFVAAADDEEGSSQGQEEAAAVEFWHAGEQAGDAGGCSTGDPRTGASEADPWAALGAATEAVHVSTAREARQAAAVCSSGPGADTFLGAAAAVSAGSLAGEDPAAAADTALWGCDIVWDTDSPAGEEAVAAQRGQQAELAYSSARAGCSGQPGAGTWNPESADTAVGQPLEWQYFDEDDLEAGFAVMSAPAGDTAGAVTRLAAAVGAAVGAAAGQAHAASKRRHADIGAAIIRALLEERQRERVDLQPLLAQLCRLLAAELCSPCGNTAVSLSALRRQCIAAVEASPQASRAGRH